MILWHHVKDSRYPDMNFNPLEKDKENSKEDFGGQDAFEKQLILRHHKAVHDIKM